MCEVAEKIYEQGIKHGEMKKAREMALNLHEVGVAEDIIAKTADVSIDLVKKWLGLSIA